MTRATCATCRWWKPDGIGTGVCQSDAPQFVLAGVLTWHALSDCPHHTPTPAPAGAGDDT